MMDQVAKHQPPPAKAAAGASHSSSDFTCTHLVYVLLSAAVYVTALRLFMPSLFDFDPEPQLFIRLVEAQGLDPCVPELRSPTLKLAVDVDRVTERKRGPCAGGAGDDAVLRVSYRGVVLAWGSVPRFCVDGGSMEGRPSATVASVVATAEGFVLREEMQNMIRAETRALGRAELDVDWSLPGLGHLRCKTYLFQGEPTEPLPPCRFQKKPREDAW